jgi:hypothetical protein
MQQLKESGRRMSFNFKRSGSWTRSSHSDVDDSCSTEPDKSSPHSFSTITTSPRMKQRLPARILSFAEQELFELLLKLIPDKELKHKLINHLLVHPGKDYSAKIRFISAVMECAAIPFGAEERQTKESKLMHLFLLPGAKFPLMGLCSELLALEKTGDLLEAIKIWVLEELAMDLEVGQACVHILPRRESVPKA